MSNLDFIQKKSLATPPVMWITPTLENLSSVSADLWGQWTSNWNSPITLQGVVLYPAWNPSTVIWWANVVDYQDDLLTSPISVKATWLAPWTNYCFKAYAMNVVGTSYGPELCFTTTTVVFVTNISANQIEKIDFNSWLVLSTLPVWSWPSWIKRIGDYLYCSMHFGNQLSKIDPVTFTVLSTIPTLNNPAEVVSYWTNLYLWAATAGTVQKVDIATFTIISSLATGNNPYTMCIEWWFLYVLLANTNQVKKIDLSTFTIVNTLALWWFVPSWAWIVSDWTYLYAARDTSIEKINIATFTVVSNLPVTAGQNQELCIVWWFLYNSDIVWNIVSKINLSTFTVSSTLNIGWPTDSVQWGMWVNVYCWYSANQAKSVNTSTMTVVNTIATGAWPHHLTF